MHVAGHVGERSDDLGMQGIVHVEDERAAHVVIVGEQHAARGHHVFGVVDADCLLVRAYGCDQLAVGGGSRVGVDDGEEVVALLFSSPVQAKR